jgi:hypothetical protein
LNSAQKNINILFKQMRLSQIELILVGLIIAYVAFFSTPPPSHIKDFLSSPVGKVLGLLGVLYVTVYQSLIVGVFLAIAFAMTATSVTEYLDEKDQSPKDEKKQPTSSGVPPPALTGALASLLKKGDTRLPQKTGKSDTTKPSSTSSVKATPPSKIEHFASF